MHVEVRDRREWARRYYRKNKERIKIVGADYRQKNREKIRQRKADYYRLNRLSLVEKERERRKKPNVIRHKLYLRSSADGRAKALIVGARARAKRSNIKFDLDVEWAVEKLRNGKCEVTGLRFEMAAGSSRAGYPFAPSIDRLDPDGPYTKSNCNLVVWIYNRSKGSFDSSAIERMAESIVKMKRKRERKK